MKNRILKRVMSVLSAFAVLVSVPEYLKNVPAETVSAAERYIPRLTAPDHDNPYYFDKNTYYQTGFGMPNCTCYAFGRAYELLGKEPDLSHGDGGAWYDYNIENNVFPYGQVPKLGAIACWGGGWYGGHVAVVEEINGVDLTLSHSSWMGEFFKTEKVARNNMENIEYDFQGYIYIGDWSNGLNNKEDNEGKSIFGNDNWFGEQLRRSRYGMVRDTITSLIFRQTKVGQYIEAVQEITSDTEY